MECDIVWYDMIWYDMMWYGIVIVQDTSTQNSKQTVLNGCFTWMTPNHYRKIGVSPSIHLKRGVPGIYLFLYKSYTCIRQTSWNVAYEPRLRSSSNASKRAQASQLSIYMNQCLCRWLHTAQTFFRLASISANLLSSLGKGVDLTPEVVQMMQPLHASHLESEFSIPSRLA